MSRRFLLAYQVFRGKGDVFLAKNRRDELQVMTPAAAAYFMERRLEGISVKPILKA
jgi:hypothetical protein